MPIGLWGALFGGSRGGGRSEELRREWARYSSLPFTPPPELDRQRAAQQAANAQLQANLLGQAAGLGGLGGALAQGPGVLMSVDPAAQGSLHFGQAPAGQIYRGQDFQPNMFTRWLDIRDSEDELQEFLIKCVHYGAKFRSVTPMSVEKLEK